MNMCLYMDQSSGFEPVCENRVGPNSNYKIV